MGQQIVYCGKCGTSLRRDDFDKGKAVVVDAISYCAACLPSPPTAKPPKAEPPRLSISSTKVRPVSTPAPATRRKVAGRGSPLPLVLGGGGALVVLIVIVILASGGSPPPAAPPAKPPAPPVDRAAADAWARLEKLATSADPDEILARCDEAEKVLRGTAFDAKLRALEASARERKKARDAERQLAMSLDDARKFMASDHRFTRQEEFRMLLARLLATPGGHVAEIRRMEETWTKELKERAAPPPPTPAPAAAGAYALGPQGEVCHWLVLGTFPNDEKQEGLHANLPDLGAGHVPALGLEARRRDGSKVAWFSHAAPDGTLSFRAVPALGAGGSTAPAVAFAACWLVAEREGKAKFRVNADTGFRVHLRGEQIGARLQGYELGKGFETFTVTLIPGPNLVVFRVGSVGGPFGLRLRVTMVGGVTERAPGVSVSLGEAPRTAKVILSENFEAGRGRFLEGEVREEDGQKVLAVPAKGVYLDDVLGARVTPTTTIHFRYKAPSGLDLFYLLAWSMERKLNHWYHVRGVKSGEWVRMSVPLKDLKGNYGMDGPSLEGTVPSGLRFYFEANEGAPARFLLIDDVEITE
jgi:hypothetical protein